MTSNKIKGIFTIAIGIIIWFMPVPTGLKPTAWHLLAIFVSTIVGFILRPLPIGAIALSSLAVTGFFGVLKPAEVLSAYGNPTIWLIVSAFIFALGFIKTGLGSRIAYKIMGAIGDSSLKLGYALAISDLIIAPATPSNTARAGGIMFPIVRSLCSAFKSEPGDTSNRLGSYLMITAFQSNCITSSMFTTAVAANALVVGIAAQAANITLSWGSWALATIVPGIIALVVCPYLVYKLNPPEITETPEAPEIARKELEKMGPMSGKEKIVAGVFIVAITLWATTAFTNLDATMIALMCISIMFAGHAIEWQDVINDKGTWDTMIWMGALIGLAGSLNKAGVITWGAKLVSGGLVGISPMVALGILLTVFMWSHYAFASTSAHVTAMYAAFLTVAIGAGAPPFLSAMSLGSLVGIMGGLTHYSVGPAPIFFGAGYVLQGKWWKMGFIISVVNFIIFIGIGGMWWKVLGFW